MEYNKLSVEENYMIFELLFIFHLMAKSPKSINNTFNKIKKILKKELELNITDIKENTFYVKKGFKNWENCIYEIIKISQEIGRQWIILGNINHNINLWTNNPIIVGVKCIEINCINKAE
jgi:hypothetical protein